jgi:hypothetical protein
MLEILLIALEKYGSEIMATLEGTAGFNKESRLNNSSNNNYNNSAADEEARKYATSTSSRIVDYIERIYQV